MRKVRTLRPPPRGPIDLEALRRATAPVCERFGLRVLYAHGRLADPGPLSDLDLAARPGEAGVDLLELTDALVVATGREDVDVTLLDEAPPELRYRVANEGALLWARDEAARLAFVTDAWRAWLDDAPRRRERRRLQDERLAEGRFGRS